MTAVLLARVQAYGGEEAVRETLRRAGTERTTEYLLDTGNWISQDEAVALLQAGARVTHHPHFARAVGEEAARRLNSSPVAALLRSLGSPEEVYRQVAKASAKFTTISTLEIVDAGPGFAEIVATPVEGYSRHQDHCAWTAGLLTQAPVLFGLEPAIVEHDECTSLGAKGCRYRAIWKVQDAGTASAPSEQVDALRGQLDAMRGRLQSMFATASDLIGPGDIGEIVSRITDRAAVEVRAPRYLLAVRTTPGGDLHRHFKGFDPDEVDELTERILNSHPASLPDSWLVVPVRSHRHDYGRLLAANEDDRAFFAQERELLEVYARYAANALDGAAALMEAKRLHGQSSALLSLARALASAGTSGEVARRLADAVPLVVDCDRASVFLWDAERREIVRCAETDRDGISEADQAEWRRVPSPGGPWERLLADPLRAPVFIAAKDDDPTVRELLAETGAAASILVPLATEELLLGLLAVSVKEHPESLRPTPDMLDRLSGIAAQATTALQNGRLLDQITYQALHDDLTGLANRAQFTDNLWGAVHRAKASDGLVTLFYVDLDRFKPVNDEFGHDAGDKVLVVVGDRLKGCTRSGDTVARLGGDEFVVLIREHTSPEEAEALGERLTEAFTRPFAVDGRQLTLGASIGRATFPADANTPEGLLRAADVAMFEVKRDHQQSSQQAALRR